MVVTSLNNEKIKNLSKLHLKKYRDESKLFLVEGDHLVYEAYKNNNLIEVILLEGSDYSFSNINVTYVTKDVMNKLSEQDSSTDIIGVCNYINNSNVRSRMLLLDGLQDPGNLGTIIRSATAFGFGIVLGDNTVDIYNSKTIRSTEGMIFNTCFIKCNLTSFIKNNSDFKYYIADMNKGVEVSSLKTDCNIAVIMGNEGNGVSSLIRDIVSDYVYIKQNKLCESLNVGVASSIIMYELGDSNE